MGIREWVNRSRERVHEEGGKGLLDSGYELYTGLWRYLGWHVPRGLNVFEQEWDTLVLLDACRVDVMREVAEDYHFVDGVETFQSVGSMSEEWMAKTFTDEYARELERTAYITANVFSDRVLSMEQFLELDEVWRYGWDDDLGVVPPRPVTDRAIAVARDRQPDRLIVHYMQPHHPFIGETGLDGFAADPFGREGATTVIDALRRGDVSREQVWTAYRANLRTVMEDVSILLENHEAETVVISSDHGEGFGEWGVYDHPAGCLHPVITNVPWVETTAEDKGTYDTSVDPSTGESTKVENRLRELGYM